MKKRIENIYSLIEGWYNNKLTFPQPLLPFSEVGEAHIYCACLKFSYADRQTKNCKRAQFSTIYNTLLKAFAIMILMFVSLGNYAQDSYIVTTDVNLRTGAGKNYKSITIVARGDTIKLLDDSGEFWAKVQYKNKIGYSAKQYIQKKEITEEPEVESVYGFIVYLSIIIIITAIIKKAGDKFRYKTTAIFLSFFFGAFGFQKFYLGEKSKGVLSIMFCWTSIPTLIGIIDFFKYAFMKEQVFTNRYNYKKKPQQKNKSNQTSQKKSHVKPNTTIDAQSYLIKSYQKGLYLNEILGSARDVKLKTANGDEILYAQQVTSIIRSKIPNATFEIKSNNTPKVKHNPPKTVVAKPLERKEKTTKPDNRDLKILSFSKKSYPNDLEMQDYVYNEQIESKKFMQIASDIEIISFSKENYPDDYAMQEYVFKEQAEAKIFISNVKDKEIQLYAIKEYPNDYSMQEFTYKEQAKCKAYMKKVSDKALMQYAITEYPEDYSMQEYIYNEQASLPDNERAINEVDETIIDVNIQNLDLYVEQDNTKNTSNQQPPYWENSYVYSYDEIKLASRTQKQFYAYFKNKVANGEFVEIYRNTNYAFILYFDFLNGYQKHRDINILEKQFILLGQICPKTKSYSLNALQDELRKRSDSYSVDKLKDLEESNYQFKNSYSDYNPDLYKLGNQYKDKLSLSDQEIKWLNKFYNPSNVFTSIEGCCFAVINVYLAVFNDLHLLLKNIDSSIDKELGEMFQKVCEIEDLAFSDYYKDENPYWAIGRFQESFFITFYKTIENLIREKYEHKRKLTFENYYPYSKSIQYIEETIGNQIQDIIIEKVQGLKEPDLETQIALNTQNVNRWKIEFDILTNEFKKEEQEKFIDAIITLEETNLKNPNIENIFYQASKFISKYDQVQSLKYYAKYIYYDLKSKKFDNRELTKTVQKSLFKTDEQINNFKEIIADLITTKDILTALEKISKIYTPKRKRIKLDRSAIKEVEQKHTDTVELLNEYLVDEKENIDPDLNKKNERSIEIARITSLENNSEFISEINMGQVQEGLVKMIIHNSYKIHKDEVDKYALDNGMFKNQLIDNINEACEEHLYGEALIEEDDDENYIIEESYYKEIAK